MPTYQCAPMHLTPAQACASAFTGQVQACSIDSTTGQPSQTGWLEVDRPDGTHAYLCASGWDATAGYYFMNAPDQLVDSTDACCNGGARHVVDWPPVSADFGVPHGPWHVKPWEQMSAPSGPIRENGFSVIVSSPDAAAAFTTASAQWAAWAGDGKPHAAPDGSDGYYFPTDMTIDYVIVPTATGEPLLVIAPEVSRDPMILTPQGHPTLGACAMQGGAPFAYLGGEVHGQLINDQSGRFGHEPSALTPEVLANARALFDCYGLDITQP
jgi:hypothetical protein